MDFRTIAVRPTVLAAIAVVAILSTAGMALADDDDDYLDCVLDKAQAIMKTQARKDAAAALKVAYKVCQPLQPAKEVDLGNETPLAELGRHVYSSANS